ncbi:hypothetical protein PC9H_002243 [Pleurotus ostreatus]|uniref:F-box domain-containing protein n=1 Tax=Pleurotus ostreatus TaxID=5322 RepID=A0A8H6ZM67_PLEOS|nr:uncharacterized protein PC9H_002243 [Pleurotus ostreatus]KAF7419651.1 hypothetical protein PC9H_002243 [Pleurotus ostreatus]
MSEILIQTNGGDGAKDVLQTAKLPVELIHLIIAFINDGNNPHETLAACSLVCRTWHNMCCRHIFDSIVIDSDNLAPRLTFFCHTAPRLSEYVRHFSISWGGRNCFIPDWSWVSGAVFKNLRTLRLENGLCSVSGPSPFLSITNFLLAAPCLKELILRGCAFENLPSLYFTLALCSNTLEQLTFNNVTFIYSPEDDKYIVSSPPHMGVLRKLDSPPRYHPVIECPNLESLIIRVDPGDVWVLPSWVPSGLTDLTIHATARRPIPDLGKNIRPSHLTLSLSGSLPYAISIQWIQGCIDRLPFPQHLRRFKIIFQRSITRPGVSYPKDTDYDNLLEIIQRLREHSALVHINLEITIFLYHALPTDWAEVKAREVPKLKRGLDPLFEANVLHATFAVRRQTSDEGLETLMEWEGGTAEWQ